MVHDLRRFALPAGLIAAAMFVPVHAHAASPQPTTFSFTEEFTDPDFCGTGETVHGTFSLTGVQFLSPKKALSAETYRTRTTYTSGDRTVVGHAAGRFTAELVSVEDGEQTFAFTTRGLPESYRIKGGGGLITRDAGRITFFVTLDADREPIRETFTASGPHPQADSGFTLFCDAIPEALGIG